MSVGYIRREWRGGRVTCFSPATASPSAATTPSAEAATTSAGQPDLFTSGDRQDTAHSASPAAASPTAAASPPPATTTTTAAAAGPCPGVEQRAVPWQETYREPEHPLSTLQQALHAGIQHASSHRPGTQQGQQRHPKYTLFSNRGGETSFSLKKSILVRYRVWLPR